MRQGSDALAGINGDFSAGFANVLSNRLRESTMSLSLKLLSLATALAVYGTANAAAVDTNVVASRAMNNIKTHMGATRATTNDAFTVRDVIVDANGTEHVRMDRTYFGLPVLGGDIVVHSRAGSFLGSSQTLQNALSLSVTPTISSNDAIARASKQFTSSTDASPTAQLIVYAAGAAPKLAYETVFSGTGADRTPTRMHYIVDARTGALLAQWDTIRTGTPPAAGGGSSTAAVGKGYSVLSGMVSLNTALNSRKFYELNDLTRGGTHTIDMAGLGDRWTGTQMIDGDNVWGNSSMSDRASVAVDAQWAVSETWDYYNAAFGRQGIANDGQGITLRVHYLTKYNDAFYDSSNDTMTFGDGDGTTYNPFVALDVTAHEISHGVTAKTANLNYSGASGALNEATSDIFGTMVEFYANNANNPPNYLIGEKVFINNPAPQFGLRSMFKPSFDGISPDCYPTPDPDPNGYEYFFNNYMDVHYSSGVANHFFFLLAEGAVPPAGYGLTPADEVCDGNIAITGIGRAAAQQIWYRALTVYMTSSTDYAGARAATLSAATDLYGAGSTTYNAVAAAWDAVNVH
jgi:Zn-dependent metalloprotease